MDLKTSKAFPKYLYQPPSPFEEELKPNASLNPKNFLVEVFHVFHGKASKFDKVAVIKVSAANEDGDL